MEKEKRIKRLLKFIKRKKKKIILFLLLVLLVGGIVGFVVYDQNKMNKQPKTQVFETQPQKLALQGWITEVYDGDTNEKPTISIYNRVIKVSVVLKLTQNTTANLTTSDQVNLISRGSSYSPMVFDTNSNRSRIDL